MRSSELHIQEPNAFYKTYINVLGDVELLQTMQNQHTNFPQFITSIPELKMEFAYAEGKWTVGEVLQHIIDAERIFQYRALRFGRGDKTALPGFDQDVYVDRMKSKKNSRERLIEEYSAVRGASLALFANFDREELERSGTASNIEWSVAALGFVICGHQRHHREILRGRYL